MQIESTLATRPETGWLVFYFARHGNIVGKLIAFGEGLGHFLRFRVIPRRIPCHVEIVCREMDGVMLYSADAKAGRVIDCPAAHRLAGLTPGKDYLVVMLDTEKCRADIQQALKLMKGRPYEDWRNVLSVWRDANSVLGDALLFCSELCIRALATARKIKLFWVRELKPDNTDPLELMLESLKHGQRAPHNLEWGA